MTTSRAYLTTTAALVLALGLSACGGDDTTSAGTSDGTQEESTAGSDAASDGSEDATDDGSNDAADDASEDGDATGAEDSDGGSTPAGDLTAAGLAAIATAEDEAGGTAYEIDDSDDDGTWEVEVAVGDRSVEVDVSADGAEVLGTEEDDLDDDDARALDAAQVSLSEAIEAALAEVGGVLDDASLEEEDGEPRFEVSLDETDQDSDDVEVLVDAVSGDVLSTDT